LAVFADPVFRRDDARLGQNGTPPTTEGATDHVIGTSFERLRFARREAERIAGIAGASAGVHLATDFDASREAVLASSLQQYRIVHFATHALVNTTRPSLSGIVLSLVTRQGEPQDGFLRLRDVYNLRLGASLVVLSACQTALGQQIHGEGIVGLTRGFMHAGVPSVVASLWDVRDEQTSELMTRFYQRLLGERMPPAAALRAAQRSMLADPRWSAPSNWAGFMVHGEWRSNRLF
jgi:CHAT domain-containing protein